MPPTPLNVTSRYTPPGVRKYYWITTAVTYTTPTRAEINAGKDLTAEIAEVTGFTLAGDSADTPDLASGFVGQVPARVTAADSEIVFWAGQAANDARTVFTRGTAGFIILLPEGDVAGQLMEIWPAKVKSMYVDTNMEDPAKVHVQFSITKIPAQNATIPA
jgi:hypothetical protein